MGPCGLGCFSAVSGLPLRAAMILIVASKLTLSIGVARLFCAPHQFQHILDALIALVRNIQHAVGHDPDRAQKDVQTRVYSLIASNIHQPTYEQCPLMDFSEAVRDT